MKMSNEELNLIRQRKGKNAIDSKKNAEDKSSGSAPPGRANVAKAPKKKKQECGFAKVAGMEELKKMVENYFINVLKHSKLAKAYGLAPPSILLYGPTGCGKTFFAHAIAEELGIEFYNVNPDNLASTYIHGSQLAIAELFKKAEKNAPAIIFFDEMESVAPRRQANDEKHTNGETNEMLCMLNEAAQRGIYVIGATNNPELIDPAILRSGRMDLKIYIDMPDEAARESIFRLSLSKLPADKNIDYNKLAQLTKGYNCSDISLIVKEASRKTFADTIASESKTYKLITQSQLEEVIAGKSPSVKQSDIREYERIRNLFSPKETKTASSKIVGFTANIY